MPVDWLAVATGGGALADILGQTSANEKNLQIAREQMAFQERMSNTAYTRAAKDLQNAGLNRILALGNPASSPQGASATMQNPFRGMATTAREIGMVKKQADLLEAQTAFSQQQARREGYQADILAPAAQAARLATGTVDTGKSAWAWLQDQVPTAKAIGESVKKKFTDNTPLEWDSMLDQLKRDIGKTRWGPTTARQVAPQAEAIGSLKDEFQKQKPSRQEQSEFVKRYNELSARGWDKKRIMWNMYQEFKGRWPDWALKELYNLYPNAVPDL